MSNLGNVLTSRGNLDQALLCYKKAISLYPPREPLASIILNKASIEMSIGMTAEAIKDLAAAEKLAGPQPSILTTKAVALSNDGRWEDAATIFEKVISTADRNALPWWLRYSQALLEINRGLSGVYTYDRHWCNFNYFYS
jgi:tetratricopeptide (TPR) repeat protein